MDANPHATCSAARRPRTALAFAALGAVAALGAGCAGFSQIPAVPASRVPPALLGERRDNRERIDIMRLRQDPPDVYLLAPRDVLGVFVENITGGKDGVPPVNFPENGSAPPSIGWPMPVREDGTLSLPQVDPIKVEGLTLVETEELVKRAYTSGANPILTKESARVVVTLMKQRTVKVHVVREDSASAQAQPEQLFAGRGRGAREQSTGRGGGFTIDLRAYENDVLNALNQTGGLPKEDAKNELLIVRGGWSDAAERDRLRAIAAANVDPNTPRARNRDRWAGNPNVTRIPLRYDPKTPPRFDEDEIILREGDIVVVEARDRDVFYTGGLLPGAEIPLPRDRDLDILGAIALAGGPLGGSGNRSGGFGGGGGNLSGMIQPTEAVIVRETDCGNVTMKVNMTKALTDPTQRVRIQPGDIVMLRYTTGESIANAFFSVVNFNFLFSGLRGSGF